MFTYRATEYPQIKVVTRDIVITDISNLKQHLEAGKLDLELEMKLTSSYMAYHLDMIINYQQASMGGSCAICPGTLSRPRSYHPSMPTA